MGHNSKCMYVRTYVCLVLYISLQFSATRLLLDLAMMVMVVMIMVMEEGTTCVASYREGEIDPTAGEATTVTPDSVPRTTREEGPVPVLAPGVGGTGSVGGGGAGGTTPEAGTRPTAGEGSTSARGTRPLRRTGVLSRRNRGLRGVGGACLAVMATRHGMHLHWVKDVHAVRAQTGGGGGGVVPGHAPQVGPDVATPPPHHGGVAGPMTGPGACRANGHVTVTGQVVKTAALKTRRWRNPTSRSRGE